MKPRSNHPSLLLLTSPLAKQSAPTGISQLRSLSFDMCLHVGELDSEALGLGQGPCAASQASSLWPCDAQVSVAQHMFWLAFVVGTVSDTLGRYHSDVSASRGRFWTVFDGF